VNEECVNKRNCCIRPSPGRERIVDVVPREGRGSKFRQAKLANKAHVKNRAPNLFHTHHRSLRLGRKERIKKVDQPYNNNIYRLYNKISNLSVPQNFGIV
jgi:hypothetical protein